jgi:hypothetical protein
MVIFKVIKTLILTASLEKSICPIIRSSIFIIIKEINKILPTKDFI